MKLNQKVKQANNRVAQRRRALAELTDLSDDPDARRSLFWALLTSAFAGGFLAQRLSPRRMVPKPLVRFLRSALMPLLPF